MPHNLTKIYDNLLEVGHLSELMRSQSLRRIFDRDFDGTLAFRRRQIRPIKKDGEASLDTAFRHLTTREDKDSNGKTLGSRSFETYRSVRLHWIKHHLCESSPTSIEVFSFEDRVAGRDKIRTYVYDVRNEYVIILEPQRSLMDYYILTAYYLNEPGGLKQINNKLKKRLPKIY
ncbi:hypothetical protein CLV60_1154 [Dyadobacter jiangsuensis]|uniref:Uncharacterized protein n=1 Tax=Dyadobacter jiangsuensis TaxID=1591085 RepID=A0A2P8FQ27_9BACT|nr:hypothetical protein CLV60_1154 [Dyadobacter jiangsuensis]